MPLAGTGSGGVARLGVRFQFPDDTITSLLSGQGFLNFQTKVRGSGKVVVTAQGEVEELILRNDKLVVDGTFVVARTGTLQYSMQRATRSLFGSMSSGEGLVATFSGTGKVLIAPIPYWRHRMMSFMTVVSTMKDKKG